jgi:aminoglycoside 2''-phosphotransferase
MDVGRYGSILRQCFPDLDVARVTFIGGGTYRVFEVEVGHGAGSDSAAGSKMIFRFPHGSQGGSLLQHERDLCAALADTLPIPIPRYVYYSQGCPLFPHPVAGYPRLPGVPLEGSVAGNVAMQQVAGEIGRFLAVLHRIPNGTTQSIALPNLGPARAIEKQRALYCEIRQHVYPVLNAAERAWTRELFESFLADAAHHCFEPVLVHGDLDSSNILWDPADGALLAIIDFEEACLGDPAWDFCVLVAEHGRTFLQALLGAYHLPLDTGFESRVAFHSQRVLFHELLYGLKHDDARFSQHALRRLRRAMYGLEPIGGWLAASTAETRLPEGHSV